MKAVTVIALIAVLILTLVPPVCAAEQQPAPAKPAATPAASNVPQRVDALEKQNLVLSEDLGKAQLKNRELEEATRNQAAAIAQLNAQLAAEQKKAAEEREKQAQRNQYMWIAVGVVAVMALGR